MILQCCVAGMLPGELVGWLAGRLAGCH